MNIEESLERIKDDFIGSRIDEKQVRERLFSYAPHPDAIESNNQLLKMWSLKLTPAI